MFGVKPCLCASDHKAAARALSASVGSFPLRILSPNSQRNTRLANVLRGFGHPWCARRLFRSLLERDASACGWLNSDYLDRHGFDGSVEVGARRLGSQVFMLELDHLVVARLRIEYLCDKAQLPIRVHEIPSCGNTMNGPARAFKYFLTLKVLFAKLPQLVVMELAVTFNPKSPTCRVPNHHVDEVPSYGKLRRHFQVSRP